MNGANEEILASIMAEASTADELTALRERVAALETAARAVCDGQATPTSVNNLRVILAQQGGEDV